MRSNGLKTAPRIAPDTLSSRRDGDLEQRIGTSAEASTSLDDHLFEARANAQAILKVVEAMERADSPDAAMLAALSSVREAFGWAYGTFWALDEGEQVLRFT